MKRIITVSIAAVLSLLMAACGRNGGTGTAASSNSAAQTTPTVIATEAASTAAVTESGAQTSATPGSMIIAESSNTISDAEKQEILDNLMTEIDGVLGNIDSLEDLDDSDLGTDNLN